MVDYLKQYSPTNELLKFNSVQNKKGEIALNTVSSERVKETYTNGDTVKVYTFAIVMMKNYDNIGYNRINLDELYDVQKFITWIKEQNRIGNLPKIPNIYSIRPLQDIPDMMSASSMNIAKYMFLCEIEYLDLKEEN